MPFTIIRNDITKVAVDAIVNAANPSLRMGGGVCGAIFRAAGEDQLQAACEKLAPIQTGEAVITPGFRLPAKYIIHTAGPIYRDGLHGEKELLRACYINSLKRAVENNCESVAFPLISSGIYGYPKADALRVATAAIQSFLANHDLDVTLVVFDKAAFAVSKELLGKVQAFIDDHYLDEYIDPRRLRKTLQGEADAIRTVKASPSKPVRVEPAPAPSIEEVVGHLDEPFSAMLLRLIDARGRTDAEVYKRANIDRKLFSKIRSNKDYRPGKRTVLALAIALELTLDETDTLLRRAGYALSHSQKFDVIIEYFILSGKYDTFEINEVLFSYDQPLLGG